ncbi:cysteine peptidase family C39 domain-containing protein [Gimesia panareensis]|uniref:cysteine peptidase family C39 domain-containing protein n=1 Tax=Gimesia panareensis TaxID=2527978 RepID=UPI0018D7AF5B|nr:cysteine peptidase family C39 domain-containing protein [Gimesia panareensis]
MVAVVSSTPRTTYSSERITQAQAKKEQYACGARAAFVLTRMIGWDASYDTALKHAPPSEQGASLEDVRNALLAHGVQCAVLRLQLTDLSSVPYPFILHVNHRGGLDVGHFYLVTGVDKIGLHTYDPVTSLKRHWPWRSFVDVWSGYAIVPTRTTTRNDQTILSCLLGIHLLVVAFVVAALRWNIKSGLRNLTGRRGSTTLTILLICGLLTPVDTAAEERLRSNLNDGANAAALLAGIYGVEIPPGEVADTAPVDSLKGIQLRLEDYGVSTSVRLLSYHELVSSLRPCVVPLRFDNTTKTSFCIFVQASDADVHLVEAGPLIVRTMSIDDFRRYWTGYAVFGNVPDSNYAVLFGWALFGFGLPLSGYVIIIYGIYGRQLPGRRHLPVRDI